ncbi:hypothetical protein ACFY36_06135 [Actinoplanes sp. NPDC000266]
MIRMLGVELRRGSGFAGAVLIVAITAAALATDTGNWQTQWTRLAYDQAVGLFILLPIALAAGAMLGRRERRTRADEVLASTPRPKWQRIVPPIASVGVALAVAHLLVFVAAGALVAGHGAYTILSSFLVPLTDSAILIGGAWLGYAAGRAWPSPMLPPALAAGGLIVQLGLSFVTTGGEAGRVMNLELSVQPPTYDWEIVNGRALLGHLVLGAGLAAAGFLLAAARSWSSRGAAAGVLTAAIAGAAFIPHTGLAGRYTIDHDAQRLVCADGTPRVCLTAVHSRELADVTPQVRRALTLLAKLPGAPTQAVEWRAATVSVPGEPEPAGLPAPAGAVVFTLDPDTDLVDSIVRGAGTANRGCLAGDEPDSVAEAAAGAWLLGADDLPGPSWEGAAFHDQVRDAVRQLKALPAPEQTQRVTALRDAAAACRTGLLPLLTGKDRP